MTDLFVALDSNQNRVVIRFIRESYRDDKLVNKSFKNGIKILGKLIHPNIVELIDSGKYEGAKYMVVQYYEAKNLRELIYKHDEMIQLNPIPILIDIAKALQYIHDQGYLHMDFKPENVLVTPEMKIIIVDFDLTTAHKNKEQKLKKIPGTPTYLSPETLKDGKVSIKSEVFCLGIIMYEMLSYKKPFDANSTKEYRRAVANPDIEATPLLNYRPDIPKYLANTIHKCLAKDPVERYPAVSLVIRDLINI